MKRLALLLCLAASAQAITVTQIAAITTIGANTENIIRTARHPVHSAKQMGAKIKAATKRQPPAPPPVPFEQHKEKQ